MADIQTSFEYTGDGTSGPWPISADYISKSYWAAQKNGAPVAFTWANDGAVNIPTAVGDKIVIWRVTPNATALTQYQNDSSLLAEDMNIENVQLLHLIQEARWTSFKENLRDTTAVNAVMASETAARVAGDAALSARADNALTLAGAGSFWEARARRLANVAYPVEENDGANLAAVRALIQHFVNTTVIPPGYDPSYDYVSLQAALGTTIPITRSHFRAAGYNGPGDRGSATWRRLGTAPAIVHAGTRQDASGNWWIISENRPSTRMFGCVGDGTADDTAAFQGAVDACIRMNLELYVDHGTYSVGPINLNGSWYDETTETVLSGGRPALRGLIGPGAIYYGARLQARAGYYSTAPGFSRDATTGKTRGTGTGPGFVRGHGKAVLTGRNMAGVAVRGLHVDAMGIADLGVDFDWVGTAAVGGGGAAPACWNAFTNLLVENALLIGVSMNQPADCLIQQITYRGVSVIAPIAFQMWMEGGGMAGNNLYTYNGAIEVAAQNASFSDCVFMGGIRVVSSAYQHIRFSSVQVSTDKFTGYSVFCPVTAGSGGANLTFDSSIFLGSEGSLHKAYFAGRYQAGVVCTNVLFAKHPRTMFACSPGANGPGNGADGSPIMADWSAAGGSGRPPVFDFNYCKWLGLTPYEFPASVPEEPSGWKVRVSRFACTRNDGIVDSTRVFGGDISVGDTGRIVADTFASNKTGIHLLNQNQGVILGDAGIVHKRAGVDVTELYHDSSSFSITSKAGTREFTFNAAIGMYPEANNTASVGAPGHLLTAVYATNGTVQTSDARLKTKVRPLSPKEHLAAADIADSLGAWQWLDDGPGGKLHFGPTVQGVMAILDRYGLKPADYSFLIHDPEADFYGLDAAQLGLFLAAAAHSRLRRLEGLVG